MHIRRLTTLLLGIWLGGGLFVWATSTWRLDQVDRLLASPAAAAKVRIDRLGHDDARALLRHQASEHDRWLTEVWENTQIALGIVLFLMLFFGSTGDLSALFIGFLMVAVVLVQRWFVLTEVIQLGRAIDFVAPDEPSVERTRYWMFHTAYTGTEALKALLGAILTLKLVRRKARRGEDDEPSARAAASGRRA